MSSPGSPQHEPTMEEILASIRKIISEDQTEAPAKPQPVPTPAAAPAPSPSRPALGDIAFEAFDPEPDVSDDDDDLISDKGRAALGRAVSALDNDEPRKISFSPPSGSDVESVFMRAVQDAFEPTLQSWVDSHSSDIMNRLKPLIRDWMDQNLPELIENAVQKELGRARSTKPRR